MTSSAQNSKQILSQKGSAATPGVSFQGDNDTGIFSSASNSMGIAAGGTKIVDVTPTGVSITGSLTPSTALAVANGGTGATTASGARTNLSAASSGANSDITSIVGLTTALTVTQGGTGAATLTGYVKGSGTAALTASATISGADISGNIPGNAANVTGTVAVVNGGTGGTTASAARTNLSAASSGANSDITSLTGLTTPLTAPQGGTGFGTYAVGDILYASTTTALAKLADVATGNAIISGGVGTAPSWGKIGLTTHVSGTLGVANGGTGLTATPTNGQLDIGNGTGFTRTTLTAGSNISVTNSSGGIQISSTPNAGIEFIIDGGGSAITTGIKGDLQIPFACTINSWTIMADQSGSIVIDVWKDTFANYPPTGADSVTGSAKPTLSAAQAATSSTLTGWTTSISANDIIRYNVDSASTVTRVTISLTVTRV